MARTHLTELGVRRARPEPGKRVEYHDDQERGLVLRIEPGGLKSWLWVKAKDKQRYKIDLGKYPQVSLSQARDKAKVLAGQLAAGTLSRKRPRKAKALGIKTVVDLKTAFIDDYKTGHKSWKNVEQDLDNHAIPLIGHMRPAKVRRTDIGDVLLELEEMPRVHNKVKSHLSGMFRWAARPSRAIVDSNPVVGFDNMETDSRDVVIRDGDIRDIWRACEDLGYPYGEYGRLLVLLGQRRTETAAMKRALVAQDIWEIPGEDTKNGLVHLVPWPAAAWEIVKRLPIRSDGKTESPYCFPAPTKLSSHLTTYSEAKELIDEKAGVRGWWLHDLRRTMTTNMAAMGIPTIVRESVLNHISGEKAGVAGIYNRYEYFEEKKAALAAWASRLREIVA